MDERRLAERLHSTAIRLLRHVRGEDLAAGLTAARLSALSVLVFGGVRTVSELAAAEQVALPTMTRLLQGMEREGLVRRRRDRADGRVIRVTATAAGRRALEAARDRRVRHLERVLLDVDEPDRRVVDDAIAILDAALEVTRPAVGRQVPAVRRRRG